MTPAPPPAQRNRAVWIPALIAAALFAAHLGLTIRRDGLLMEVRQQTRAWRRDGYPEQAEAAVEWLLDRTYALLRVDGVSVLLCAGWVGAGAIAAQRGMVRRRTRRDEAR
jgi:hypothetical protein